MQGRPIITLAAVALLATTAGCGQNSTASSSELIDLEVPPAVTDLYEAAKEEGPVVYWQSSGTVEMAQVLETFSARFPGVSVEPVTIQPQEGVEKVVSEARTSDSPVDLLELAPIYATPLVDRDLALQPDWTGDFGIPKEELYSDGTLVVSSHLPVPVMYNPDLIDAEDVPRTWDDLASPDLANGQLAIDSRGFMFAYLALERGRDEALRVLDDVLANDPLPLKGAGPIGQAVSTGEVKVAVGPYISSVEFDKSRGANVDWLPWEDLMPAIPYGNVVIKAATNPNGAQLLAWWLNSEEGVRAREAAGLHPQRLTGSYIPEESQKVLDSGVKLVFDTDTPEGEDLIGSTLAEIVERIGGLS